VGQRGASQDEAVVLARLDLLEQVALRSGGSSIEEDIDKLKTVTAIFEAADALSSSLRVWEKAKRVRGRSPFFFFFYFYLYFYEFLKLLSYSLCR
jgi:hypothetical protein